jgi:hypothetical protein
MRRRDGDSRRARYRASSLGLQNPRDLAIGTNGDVYISDATDRVTEISPGWKGAAEMGWAREGTRAFKFVSKDTRDPNDLAAALAVGQHGDVYVSDSGNARVEVFSPTGRFLRAGGCVPDHRSPSAWGWPVRRVAEFARRSVRAQLSGAVLGWRALVATNPVRIGVRPDSQPHRGLAPRSLPALASVRAKGRDLCGGIFARRLFFPLQGHRDSKLKVSAR